TSHAGSAIACHVPEVDDVIAFDAPWVKNDSADEADAVLALRDTLASRRFDGAVIFTVYSQNPLPAAMLCYLAGIPLRLAHCRENPYHLLTDWVAEPEPQRLVRHEVRRQLDLVSAIGCRASDERMAVLVPDRARDRVGMWLGEQGLRDG